MRVAWVMFAKPPIHGFVKTRLAQRIGDETALELYKLILKWQWGNLRSISQLHQLSNSSGLKIKPKLFIFVAQPMQMKLKEALTYFDFLPRMKELNFKEQSPGNLGEKLANALSSLARDFDFIVTWGSDIASLSHYDLEKSLPYHSSACILPASDGGYCLIGMNSKLFQKELFDKISWSSASTFKMQKKRFDDLLIPVNIMHTMPDLDTSEDIVRNVLYMEQFVRTHEAGNEARVYEERLKEWSAFWKQETSSI